MPNFPNSNNQNYNLLHFLLIHHQILKNHIMVVNLHQISNVHKIMDQDHDNLTFIFPIPMPFFHHLNLIFFMVFQLKMNLFMQPILNDGDDDHYLYMVLNITSYVRLKYKHIHFNKLHYYYHKLVLKHDKIKSS